jgi:O-antigen/teichoic acid export membrane protein
MNSKTLTRIGFISNNALRQVLVSAFNMAIPFMVISNSPKETWGSFVPMLLFTLLALQVINWGNKEYQIRQFSQSPGKMRENYSQIFATRFPLVVVFAVIGFFYFPNSYGLFILLWIIGRFLVHSAEALVIYEKKFFAAMTIELGSFALFCIAFWFLKTNLDLFSLLILYSFYQLIKGIAYLAFFARFLSVKSLKIESRYYKVAFPFFLLSVLGFLASKADVYVIANFGNKIMTADYQVINSLLVFIMSLSAFIYAPFTKNIYRNSEAVIDKTRKLLLLSGLLVVPAALVAVWLVMKYYLDLNMPPVFFIFAFAYVFPAFAYGIEIVNLFRVQKEKIVVAFLFIGAFTNTLLSALFLNYGIGMTGALAGSAIAQIIVLILFKSKPRREK